MLELNIIIVNISAHFKILLHVLNEFKGNIFIEI